MRRVDPSISLSRNATVPDGRLVTSDTIRERWARLAPYAPLISSRPLGRTDRPGAVGQRHRRRVSDRARRQVGAPGRTRTADAGLRTASLYPLSYGGAGGDRTAAPANDPLPGRRARNRWDALLGPG